MLLPFLSEDHSNSICTCAHYWFMSLHTFHCYAAFSVKMWASFCWLLYCLPLGLNLVHYVTCNSPWCGPLEGFIIRLHLYAMLRISSVGDLCNLSQLCRIPSLANEYVMQANTVMQNCPMFEQYHGSTDSASEAKV